MCPPSLCGYSFQWENNSLNSILLKQWLNRSNLPTLCFQVAKRCQSCYSYRVPGATYGGAAVLQFHASSLAGPSRWRRSALGAVVTWSISKNTGFVQGIQCHCCRHPRFGTQLLEIGALTPNIMSKLELVKKLMQQRLLLLLIINIIFCSFWTQSIKITLCPKSDTLSPFRLRST